MELDKRIKEGKRPLTCLDVEQAREFEGKLCLFSSSFVNYKNIREYAKYPQYTGTLSVKDKDKFKYITDEESPYRNENDGYFYELVLPLEWVKEPEKKYRPFSLEEFLKIFDIGDQIGFRSKDNGEVKYAMLVGYTDDFFADNTDRSDGENDVMIGIYRFSLSYLFENYDLYFEDEWQPFGVLDEQGAGDKAGEL